MLDLLQFELISVLTALFFNAENLDSPDSRIWLRQDDEPPNYAHQVRGSLEEILPNRCIILDRRY